MSQDGDPARDPDSMLRRWTRQGWVHRSIDYETRTERYQLTAGAHQAVQQIRSVHRHSSTATQSALAMVMTELRQIAVEASPDPQQRAEALAFADHGAGGAAGGGDCGGGPGGDSGGAD